MRWSFLNYIMFKSSRKKLIALGCSYTEHYIRSSISPNINHNFTRWPQHLADMLDMECINLGSSGSGNDQILAKALDVSLNEKNIGLIVLMWSEWQRVGFQTIQGHEEYGSITKSEGWNRWDQVTPHQTDVLSEAIFEKQNPIHATRTTFRTFIYAENFLRNLPYLFIQGTNPLVYETSEERKKRRDDILAGRPVVDGLMGKINQGILQTTKEIISSPYLNYIEKNIGDKFIGWPVMSELGGYGVDNILDKVDPMRKKLRISLKDSHPNAEGHKIISQEIYDAYEKIYI